MSEINDIDFEEDQQEVIEKTDINPLASYVGNWPNVGPGTFDLNGGVPSRGKYVDNAPEGAYI